jgi:glycosyltransferase involved in cell wall biosynthesis
VRFVFVNRSHPDTPHVSGMRVWRFAQEMARRGHHVVVVSSTHGEGDAGKSAAQFDDGLLASHDWTKPLLVAVAPVRLAFLSAARSNALPAPVRRAFTLYASIVRGGVFYDWTVAAVPHAQAIAARFRPELVWGTFSDLSNLTLARRIAAAAQCRLAYDFKDSISVYGPNLPRGLRKVFSLPLRSFDCLTSNADALGEETRWYLGRPALTVYSGVDPSFFASGSEADASRPVITLTGSVRSEVRLREILRTLKTWNAGQDDTSRRFTLRYFGSDLPIIEPLVREENIATWVELTPYIPIDRLGAECRAARANLYIRAEISFPGGPLHHKLLELLATGRPVIAYGGETEESFRLRDQAGGVLHAPTTPDAFHQILAGLCAQGARPPMPVRKTFAWEDQAARLEEVLVGCVKEPRRCAA